MQSKEKLAYKGIVLNVVVNKDIIGIRALSIIFNTNPMNNNYVDQRCREIKASESSQWAFLTRK